MELENKFAKLYKTIFQNLLGTGDGNYVHFSINHPLYFLERIITYLVQSGKIINFFEERDFEQLSLSQEILTEVADSVDDDIKQLSEVELRNLCRKLTNQLLANRSQWFYDFRKGKPNDFHNSRNADYVLYDFVVELIKPSPNQIIYAPQDNLGGIFIRLNSEFPDCNLKFIGQESGYDDSIFICKVNLFANGLEKVSSIYHETALDISFNQPKPKADIAIATNLSHGLIYSNDDEKPDLSTLEVSEKIRSYDIAYIELMLSSAKDDGKVIVVVPDNFLGDIKNKPFRKKYLENDWVEKIILLPKNVYTIHSSTRASIMVLNKNKPLKDKGFVIFDSKETDFEETRISNNEIISTNGYNLRTKLYAWKPAKEVKNILENSSSVIVKIRTLIQTSVSGVNYSPKNRISKNSDEELPYIRVTDLAKNETDFRLKISDISRKVSRKKARKNTIIDFSTVLVSKIAPNLKPTYFNFTGQPIVIGSDIIALKMKENIDVEYFLTQLHSQLVQTQVEMMSSGATIKRISTKDFLNIQIFLPTLEEQQRQILEMRGVIEEKAIAQEKVAKAEEQTEAIEYEVIANMNHSLKNKLGVIINDYDTLVRFLQRKERTNSAVSFNDTIRPVFEGENVADVDTIKLITQRLKNNLLDTSKVFNTSLKLQTRELNKTPVELVSYFRNELKSLYAGQNFKIEVVAKPGLKLNILIDKEVFKEAIDNLINNAKSHGFVEKDREYKIVFELSKSGEVYDEDSETVKNYARIIYKNDGKSFPKGFSFNDYVRYSSKAGKTQGTGIGGAIVDRIIKLHEGKFNEIPNGENSLFSVKFEILLPLDD